MACWQGCHICLGRETAWVQHSFSRALNREPIHVVGHRTESPTDQPVFSNNPLPSFSGGASARLDLWISCVWRECESDPSLENGELWQIWAFALHMPPQCWLEKLLQRLLYEVSVKHSVLFSFVFFRCQLNVTRLLINYFIQFTSGQPEDTSGVWCQVLPHLLCSSCTTGFFPLPCEFVDSCKILDLDLSFSHHRSFLHTFEYSHKEK